VSGTVSDNVGVAKVTWIRIERGFGNCYGHNELEHARDSALYRRHHDRRNSEQCRRQYELALGCSHARLTRSGYSARASEDP
jgi:hypothetical protein